MTGLGDYPPGAENDSRAPWNEPDKEPEECSECGKPAMYVQPLWSETPLGTPIGHNFYYCDECFSQYFENYLEDVEDYVCTEEDFMQEENIEML